MSLVRSFTSRRNRQEPELNAPMFHIGRAASQRGGRPVRRELISSPLALISTSNFALDKARPIAGASPREFAHVQSRSSASSDRNHESEGSSLSPDNLTDASSVDESISPIEHTASPFGSYQKHVINVHPTARSYSQSSSPKSYTGSFEKTNQWSATTTHKTTPHQDIARLTSPFPDFSNDASYLPDDRIYNTSHAFVEAPRDTPFRHELAQLDLVREEYGSVVRDAQTMDDLAAMQLQNLAYFCASDYLQEIYSLTVPTNDQDYEEPMVWI